MAWEDRIVSSVELFKVIPKSFFSPTKSSRLCAPERPYGFFSISAYVFRFICAYIHIWRTEKNAYCKQFMRISTYAEKLHIDRMRFFCICGYSRNPHGQLFCAHHIFGWCSRVQIIFLVWLDLKRFFDNNRFLGPKSTACEDVRNLWMWEKADVCVWRRYSRKSLLLLTCFERAQGKHEGAVSRVPPSLFLFWAVH